MFNSLCPICFNEENESFITLPCNYKVCVDFLTQWITLKISENRLTIDSKTTCIMANCKKDASLQEIFEKLSFPSQQKIDEALLQIYLASQQDIRKCPNSNCHCSGIINTKSSCTSPLQCHLCGTQWRDKQHFSTFERIKNWFLKTNTDNLSEIWIKQKAKKCPSCKVNIEKNGGCNHMTCKNCNFQFCWICMTKSKKHLDLLHLYYQNPSLVVTVLVILSLLIYAIYSFEIMSIPKFFVGGFFWIIYRTISFFVYMLWNFGLSILNLIISNGFVIMTLAMIYGKRIPFQKRMKGILGIFAFIWVSISINYFSTILGILKLEFFILLGAGLCAFVGISCLIPRK